jgi:hypothetical protein
MGRTYSVLLVLAVTVATTFACGGSAQTGAQATVATPRPACRVSPVPTCDRPGGVTYVRDVRPILEQRCFGCHAGNGEAADEHDFSHAEKLRAQRVALANEIGACSMPPSPRPHLESAEAELLLAWVACGAVDR